MKCNNLLLTALAFLLSLTLFSCASSHKKSVVAATSENNQHILRDSVLPPGPITPNPYLQTTAKTNAATASSFQAAIAAINNKQWGQAEQLLQALSAANPTLSGVALNLGIVYRNTGDINKATEQFNNAISINPKNLDAYNQLAIIKREAGDFSAAETLYLKALEVWPYHSDSHKNIAILYELYKGEPEQALPHYLAYQKLLPEPDRQVDSWIADLQRRVDNAQPKPAESQPAEAAQEEK